MTIGNALAFIKRGYEDDALRKRLNSAASMAELEDILVKEKLMFSAHDFDEAYHHSLTLCQEVEEADKLSEFKMWWDLLLHMIGPVSSGKQCSGCC